MNFTLKIWRQPGRNAPGELKQYAIGGVLPDMSFLEMLDGVNQDIVKGGGDPVAFDSDCREGICGTCGFLVRGVPHGPESGTTVCQLHMRHFKEGAELTLEPWRAKAFPVIRDLVVDRGAFDRIVQAGGYVSVNTGGVPDGNAIPVPKADSEEAMDAAACIGCGACVAACKNAAAMLFVGAKVAHLAYVPQGQPERSRRVLRMVEQMEKEGFGACSNEGECEAVCPKEISVGNIQRLNREYVRAMLKGL